MSCKHTSSVIQNYFTWQPGWPAADDQGSGCLRQLQSPPRTSAEEAMESETETKDDCLSGR